MKRKLHFRPFNSAFERNIHTIGKQKKDFNKHGLLNAEKFVSASISQRDMTTMDNSPLLGQEVISGNRALIKAKQLQNNGCVKRILNGYIKMNNLNM